MASIIKLKLLKVIEWESLKLIKEESLKLIKLKLPSLIWSKTGIDKVFCRYELKSYTEVIKLESPELVKVHLQKLIVLQSLALLLQVMIKIFECTRITLILCSQLLKQRPQGFM